MSEFRILSLPQLISWPVDGSALSFIDVYDWDQLKLNPNSTVSLSIKIELCSGFFPCTLFLIGHDSAVMYRSYNGSISCLRSLGCNSMIVEKLQLSCGSPDYSLMPVLEVQGARLSIFASVFNNCNSRSDGSFVLAYGGAELYINSSSFNGCHSSGFGGALSFVDSNTYVFNTTVQMCTADKGGGAIWASFYHDYQINSSKSMLFELVLEFCIFKDCSSIEAGGGILISSQSSRQTDVAHLGIISSAFFNCSSGITGGAMQVSTTGNTVYVDVVNANFTRCSAKLSGGAISAGAFAFVNLQSSNFAANEAMGNGGGALYLNRDLSYLENCSFKGNKAWFGGGGAILYELNGGLLKLGPTSSLTFPHFECNGTNFAAYGPCFGSTFFNLQVSLTSSKSATYYAGIPFEISVVKLDIFNQVILSDSESLVQLQATGNPISLVSTQDDPSVSGNSYARLEKGSAFFIVAISPKFSIEAYHLGFARTTNSSYIFVSGSNAEGYSGCESAQHMVSNTAEIVIQAGASVCQNGYVLLLDHAGHGVCSRCGVGSYSLSPLTGAYPGKASCLNCMINGVCYSGDNVSLPVGVWVIAGGKYVLNGCPEGHQLQNSINGIFNYDIQQCLVCKPSQINVDPNNSMSVCQEWSGTVYLALSLLLMMSKTSFSASQQFLFATAIANTTHTSIDQVFIAHVESNFQRRKLLSYEAIQVDLKISASNTTTAAAMKTLLSQTALDLNFAKAGLPVSKILSAEVINTIPENVFSLSFISGVSVAGVVSPFILFACLYFILIHARKIYAHQVILDLVARAEIGGSVSEGHLPLTLQSKYIAETCIGKGAFSCILKVSSKHRKNAPTFVKNSFALKVVVSHGKDFNERELWKLKQEASILEMLSQGKCECAVNLASLDGSSVAIASNVAWFLMELVDGGTMGVGNLNNINDTDCIKMARSVLSALKVLHAEGIIHCDISPNNILLVKSKEQGLNEGEKDKTTTYPYRLIDFGSARDLQQDMTVVRFDFDASKNVFDLNGQYMSPEMWLNPLSASYPTDLWSLGVTMFELVSGHLPFENDQEPKLFQAIAGNLDIKTPSLLEKLEGERRANFDLNLAKVIEKATEKNLCLRYSTVNEMYDAVYQCLISRGEAYYTVFISYRVLSEAPLAQIIFDELNHSLTPGGNRVTVFWDSRRLVKAEGWEEGFANGLLNSLCIFPLLSYGATAPLATIGSDSFPSAIRNGWEERPVGRQRLCGDISDKEDNVLKELLIAASLLSQVSNQSDLDGACGAMAEVTLLQLAYPILVGRQQPMGHPDYPRMGNFFEVQGGGGYYPKMPSTPTNEAVIHFLKERTNLNTEALNQISRMSVDKVIWEFTKLQGCRLWDHSKDLMEIDLSSDQKELIGKGYVGPAVDLGGVSLSLEQKKLCSQGFDERQLRMLKAQVRAKLADFHDVIDRAVGHASASTGALTRKRTLRDTVNNDSNMKHHNLVYSQSKVVNRLQVEIKEIESSHDSGSVSAAELPVVMLVASA